MIKSRRPDPLPGEYYRHFKGNLYEIVTIAVHTETSDKLVVYRSVDTPTKVFARPIDMFMSDVDHIRYPFIKAKYRFTLVSAPQKSEKQVDGCSAESEKSNICINDAEAENTAETAAANIPAEETTIITETETELVSENTLEETPVNSGEEADIPVTQNIVDLETQSEEDDTIKYHEDGTLVLDPTVEALLDEKEFTKKIEYFQLLRGKCTEEMLTTIAISLDMQLSGETIEDKYAEILKTLRMHEKYESARLRF